MLRCDVRLQTDMCSSENRAWNFLYASQFLYNTRTAAKCYRPSWARTMCVIANLGQPSSSNSTAFTWFIAGIYRLVDETDTTRRHKNLAVLFSSQPRWIVAGFCRSLKAVDCCAREFLLQRTRDKNNSIWTLSVPSVACATLSIIINVMLQVNDMAAVTGTIKLVPTHLSSRCNSYEIGYLQMDVSSSDLTSMRGYLEGCSNNGHQVTSPIGSQ